MTNVRRIWHFKLQSSLHREMLNPSITKKFAIAILKVELHYSSIVKKKKKNLFSPDANLLSPLSHFLCSLLSLPSLFLIFSLLSSGPNTILLPTSTSHITVTHFFWWVAIRQILWLLFLFYFFGMGDGMGHYGGYGFWHGSLWWL